MDPATNAQHDNDAALVELALTPSFEAWALEELCSMTATAAQSCLKCL